MNLSDRFSSWTDSHGVLGFIAFMWAVIIGGTVVFVLPIMGLVILAVSAFNRSDEGHTITIDDRHWSCSETVLGRVPHLVGKIIIYRDEPVCSQWSMAK